MMVAAIGECTQRSLYKSELPQKLIAACRLSHVSIELFILFYVSKRIDITKWKQIEKVPKEKEKKRKSRNQVKAPVHWPCALKIHYLIIPKSFVDSSNRKFCTKR